jgi:hypothetical protein
MSNFSLFRRLFMAAFCMLLFITLLSCGGTSGSLLQTQEGADESDDSSDVLPTSLSINVSTLNVYVGLDQPFTVSIQPEGASSLVTWSVHDSDIASIDSSGLVTGIATGEVSIVVVSDLDASVQASITLNVAAIQWTTHGNADWIAREYFAAVTMDGKIWVLGGVTYTGYPTDVYYSVDGESWTTATSNAGWSAGYGFPSIVNDGEIMVIGGFGSTGSQNDVYVSEGGGLEWTTATLNAGFSNRWGHQIVKYGDYYYMTGGLGLSFNKEVWKSSDGVAWTQIQDNAAWQARMDHRMVVFNDAIYLLGGLNGDFEYLNDIWKSSDGISWTQVTTEGEMWSGRMRSCSFVYGNKIWVISGGSSAGEYSDIWVSDDAIHWSEVPQAGAHWAARTGAACVIHDDQLWIMGGTDGTRFHDVWSMHLPSI